MALHLLSTLTRAAVLQSKAKSMLAMLAEQVFQTMVLKQMAPTTSLYVKAQP
jgi:hypothetical protein